MERWGRFVFRRRWWVLAGSLLVFIATVGLLVRGGSLHNQNRFDFEANRGFILEGDQLPNTAGSSFQLVMGSPSLRVGDAAFAGAVTSALAPLKTDHRVTGVAVPPLDRPPATPNPAISSDGHYIVASIGVTGDFSRASEDFPSIRDQVRSDQLTIHSAGDLALNSDFNTQSQQDLQRADISLPAALVLLVIVFGSAVAALLCLGVGVFAVAGGIAATFELSHHTDVSVYALNVVGLIGLGVAIDYSLFIVNRFREELRRGSDREEALAVTMRTAGTAIAFSGLTVAVGLSGLLFYSGTFLGSLGITGGMVVVISVLYSLTLLPAFLAVLGQRVNRWRPATLLRWMLRRPRPTATGAVVSDAAAGGRGFWHGLAMAVMRRPVLVLVPCLAVLLLAGTPFTQMRLANANVTLLPPTADVRQGIDLLNQHFNAQGQNSIDVVVNFQHGSPFAPGNVAAAYELAQRVKATPGVQRLESYVSLDAAHDLAGYQQLYAGGVQSLPATLAQQVRQTTGSSIVVLRAITGYDESGDQARNLVRDIRSHDSVSGAEVAVTGNTAFDIDFVNFMLGRTPGAVIYVMVVTFFILLLLLRSVVLPLKAVVMNLLSLSAAFGAMVWIFQQGHLSGVFNFTPASIDPTLPILLFCIVFGLSMDYEVFLLTRMQEAWLRHRDNRAAVAEGLEASGRLVTGAAAIMITVFAAFGLASVVVIKSIGIGMAVAVFVDATIVRALVVPALMRLLGDVNWWAPAWMRHRGHPRELPEAA